MYSILRGAGWEEDECDFKIDDTTLTFKNTTDLQAPVIKGKEHSEKNQIKIKYKGQTKLQQVQQPALELNVCNYFLSYGCKLILKTKKQYY